MTPAQRAAALIADVREVCWIIEFVRRNEGATVHIVGPAADQDGYADIVEALLIRKFRAVCGQNFRLHPTAGTVGEFPDERLCHSCHQAFDGLGFEDQALIFEHATDAYQSMRHQNGITYQQNPERWPRRASAR